MTWITDKSPGAALAQRASLVPIDDQFVMGIKAILHSAVERLQLVNAATMLRGLRCEDQRYLMIGEQLRETETLKLTQVEEFFTSTELPMSHRSRQPITHESVSLSINIGNQRLGYLVVATDTLNITPGSLPQGLAQATTEVVALVKRYQTRARMLATFGPQPYFIGCSKALRQVDLQIDKLAAVAMPVIIRGDKGTGKLMAARALHCHGHNDELAGLRPFIESSCEDWEHEGVERTLLELWSYARGGTLFLRNIDKLPEASFNVLREFWRTKTAVDGAAAREINARLLASLSSSNPFPANENSLLEQWLEFNFLELHLPRLHERRMDVRALSRHFIDEYHLDIDFDFSEEAWQLLESFQWPENVQQLKKLIQKLAILVEEPQVSAALLLQLFPSLELPADPQTSLPKLFAKTGVVSSLPGAASLAATETLINAAIIFGGLRELKWEHPLLLKAVNFMIANHHLEIDVLDAAITTGITATQLADLLKHRLGLSFHQVMNKIRVEQAKTLFQETPTKQIDQVCIEIGFNDIGGFEKIFKRMVGISPKVYRGQFFKPLSLSKQ